MELQYADNRYKKFQNNSYQIPERDTDEYKIVDPALYVTKVITPENEMKKRLVAKELSEALEQQIKEKQERKAAELREKIEYELKEEARLKKQIKPVERKTGRARVQVNYEPRSKANKVEPIKHSPPPNKVKNSPAQIKWENTSVMKIEDENHNVEAIGMKSENMVVEYGYNIVDYNNELDRLQKELYEKNQEFNRLLDNLKDHSTKITNTRDQAERDLSDIKRLISSKAAPFEQLITRGEGEMGERKLGMSRYSPLYLNNYNNILNRNFINESRDYSRTSSRTNSRESSSLGLLRSGNEVLHGESHMIMWHPRKDITSYKKIRPIEGPKSSNRQYKSYILKEKKVEENVQKTKYEKLDDIIKELLEDINLDESEKEDKDEVTDPNEISKENTNKQEVNNEVDPNNEELNENDDKEKNEEDDKKEENKGEEPKITNILEEPMKEISDSS